jgi:CRISPR-associated protein Cas1
MTDRILDLSDSPARLSVRYDQLVLERDGEAEVTVPLMDMAVLIVAHPTVRYSHAVLTGLIRHGAMFVVCDEKFRPAGMLLPLEGNVLQAERFALQAAMGLPVKKRLWGQVVRAKLQAQSALLIRLHERDGGIARLIGEVRSGDPENVEAQAARIYWNLLFHPAEFVRRRDGEDQNRFLNYGYAVLRAAVTRGICGAGLHPSLGLHHHNRYNAFALADDLMEPFRAVVDEAVVGIVRDFGPQAPMDREVKRRLLTALTGRVRFKGESRTLFDAASRTASSLVRVLEGETDRLVFPDP